MINAAGILIAFQGKVLFLRRTDGGDHAGEWCFPGGKIEAGETAQQAALRESSEEIGWSPDAAAPLKMLTRTQQDGVDFTTFLSRPPAEPVLKLDPVEHDEYQWAAPDQAPQPLHPGCQIALDRLKMNELDVAKAIITGDLTSPQPYGGFWLFAIRITGTDLAYRDGVDEYVWRDPKIYLTDEFLERCQGLPAIFDHPESEPLLNSEEFNGRIVGMVFIPYIKNDEVWGITKIYDAGTAEALRTNKLSTSPGVSTSGTQKTFDNGAKLLIENSPNLVDHIAICENGVWDKGGAPTGIDSTLVRHDSVKRRDEMVDVQLMVLAFAAKVGLS